MNRLGAAGAMLLVVTACETGGPAAGPSPAPDAAVFTFDFATGPEDAAPLPDASPPLPDPAACASACEPLAACAGADAPDGLCDGIDAREIEAFAEQCAAVCAASPGFPEAFAGLSECRSLLERMRAVAPPLAYICVPSPPPATPACATFGDRVAACVGAACAAAVPVQDGLSYWLRLSCDQGVAAGQLSAATLSQLPGAETPCDDPVAANIVESLVGDPERPGTLTALCTFGPVLEDGTCAAACEHLRPCLPARNALRNEPYCRFVCALDEGLRDPLTCAAAAPECGPLNTCFGG